MDVRRVTRFVPPAWWVAAAGSAAGVLVVYLTEAQQTTTGRVSALVVAHVMPYLSVLTACYAVAVGALVSLATRGSVARGVALGVAAGLAAIAATPADITWHSSFGVDGALWAPPHLLSVMGTAALLAAVLAVTGPGGAGRLAVGAALLAVTQVVVAEYDMDVPQYPGILYLPLLVCTGLGGAWVVHRTAYRRFAVSWALAVFLLFRTGVLAVLGLLGLPGGPDLPVALLGLAVVDVLPARWGRVRWPLAGLAVTAGQVAASVAGVSGVPVQAVLDAAVVVVPVLLFSLVLLRFGRVAVPAALAVVLLGGMSVPVARAHAPGSGPPAGTAAVAVSGDGAGGLDVSVSRVRGLRDVELTGARLVARRGGRTVTGDVLRPAMSAAGPNRVGAIRVPGRGLWFVYLEWPGDGRHRELWRAIAYDTTATTVERRQIYWKAPPVSRSTAEYLAALLLYGLSAGLVVWVAMVLNTRLRLEESTVDDRQRRAGE